MFRFYYDNELLGVSNEIDCCSGFAFAIEEDKNVAKACYNYLESYGLDLEPFESISLSAIESLFFQLLYYEYNDFPDEFIVCEYGLEIFNEPIKGNYSECKELARQEAIDYQTSCGTYIYSMNEEVDWCDYFTKLGKKYGLLTEFRENAIC